jgi:hypothetical protein
MRRVMAASPRLKPRSCSSSSALRMFLTRYPCAPALMASTSFSVASCTVSMTAVTSGKADFSRRGTTSDALDCLTRQLSALKYFHQVRVEMFR